MKTRRSTDGRFELRHTATENPWVAMYGGDDLTDLVWELVLLATGETVARFTGSVDARGAPSGVRAVAFDSAGRHLVVDGERHALDALVAEAAARRRNTPVAFALDAGGNTLAVANAAGEVVLLEAGRRRVRRRIAAPFSIEALAFVPAADHLLLSGRDHLGCVGLGDGAVVWNRQPKNWNPVQLRFSPDGTWVAARQGYPYELLLLEVDTGHVGHRGPLENAAFGFTADGTEVVHRGPGAGVVARRLEGGATRTLGATLPGDARLRACLPAQDRLFISESDRSRLTTLDGQEVAGLAGTFRDCHADVDGDCLVAVFEGSCSGGELLGEPHHIRVLDPATGRERTRIETIVHSPVAVGGGRLWTKTDAGLLVTDLHRGTTQVVSLA